MVAWAIVRTTTALVLAATLTVLGCSRPDRGTEESSLQHGGLERTFAYHIPAGAPAEGSRMLVISLHGRGGTGLQQEDLTALSALSDERGFIAVYPDGVDKSWADGRGTSGAEMQGVDDIGFLSALIDLFVGEHGVDPKRVYLSGHSNGAMMTSRAGCELASKLAAIGPVAGSIPANVAMSCKPARPVSVMAFHGTDDEFAPYAGGEVDKGSGGAILGAKEALAWWAENAGCNGEVTLTEVPDTAPDDGTTAEREDAQGCTDGAEVTLFSIVGGGHTWPSSPDDLGESLVGKSSQDVDASALHVGFFEKHPMP